MGPTWVLSAPGRPHEPCYQGNSTLHFGPGSQQRTSTAMHGPLSGSGNEWPVACSVPSHYLNQCWVIVNCTIRNKLKLHRNFNHNTKLSFKILENAFVYVDQNAYHFVYAVTNVSNSNVNIGSGNGLVPGAKPLPEPMLTQWLTDYSTLTLSKRTSHQVHTTERKKK